MRSAAPSKKAAILTLASARPPRGHPVATSAFCGCLSLGATASSISGCERVAALVTLAKAAISAVEKVARSRPRGSIIRLSKSPPAAPANPAETPSPSPQSRSRSLRGYRHHTRAPAGRAATPSPSPPQSRSRLLAERERRHLVEQRLLARIKWKSAGGWSGTLDSSVEDQPGRVPVCGTEAGFYNQEGGGRTRPPSARNSRGARGCHRRGGSNHARRSHRELGEVRARLRRPHQGGWNVPRSPGSGAPVDGHSVPGPRRGKAGDAQRRGGSEPWHEGDEKNQLLSNS